MNTSRSAFTLAPSGSLAFCFAPSKNFGCFVVCRVQVVDNIFIWTLRPKKAVRGVQLPSFTKQGLRWCKVLERNLFFRHHRSDSDKRNIYQCHTFFMPRCTCASCCHFEQASGFPKLLAARTIRRHLAKQKLVARSIDSALSIVNTPVLSPVNSPFLASEPLSDSSLELDLEHGNSF